MNVRCALAAAMLMAGAHGCARAEAVHSPAQRSSAMLIPAIPPAPVAGSLNGRRFEMREAWYRVQRKHGRERIDLILSEGRATRLCAESDPETSRHVWLRFPGWQRFEAGEFRVDPPAVRPLSVHYEEVPREREWTGTAGASAVVVIDSASGDSVVGRLRACFGDSAQSCVAGSFRALECRSELDPDGPHAGNVRRATHDGGVAP